MMKKVLVAAVALMLVMSAVAFAANNPVAKVAIHVRPHNAKAGCTITPPIVDCTGIITTDPNFSVDAFPIFYDLTEFKGVLYGLMWPAWTYSAAFTSCSDLVIGAVDWPGSGAAHTWFECQVAPVAVPSFVWLYADGPGMICPIGHPFFGTIEVLDCAEGIDFPCAVFCAGVYGATGDDPCGGGASATEQSTWGGIKSIFE